MKQTTADLDWFWFSWHWTIKDPLSKTGRWKRQLNNLKKGKTIGPNNITNDLIHAARGFIYRRLALLFNQCLFESKIPDEWKITIVILLYKNGDPKDIANFRPISSPHNIYKLFTKIITNRITNTTDVIQPKEKPDFRKGFSMIDHLHVVNQLAEKCSEDKLPLPFGLTDYNISLWFCWNSWIVAFKEQDAGQVYINVLLHISIYARFYKDWRSFRLRIGVRKGGTSIPTLHCLPRTGFPKPWLV